MLFGLGAQFGRGCTSGAALSGMAVLSSGGIITMAAIFEWGTLLRISSVNYGSNVLTTDNSLWDLSYQNHRQTEFNYVVALLIGIAFGFVLGTGRILFFTKLAGVFYGYDFTVLRVFFYCGRDGHDRRHRSRISWSAGS